VRAKFVVFESSVSPSTLGAHSQWREN